MTSRPAHVRLLALAPILATLFGSMAGAADDQESGSAIDCGPMALYQLSCLMGRPLELDAIRSRLPLGRAGNFSMEELRQTAEACGLGLRGVLLDRGDGRAIDRPMPVFLNRGDHGHFLTIRPVGESGKLVQVVDSANRPVVMDKSALLAAKSWTGLALIADAPPPWNKPVVRAVGIALAFGILILSSNQCRLAAASIGRRFLGRFPGSISNRSRFHVGSGSR